MPQRDPMRQQRAQLEALLEGVSLPATKKDLAKHLKAYGGKREAASLKRLPSRRYATIDEVGEALQPVQPDRSQGRKTPRPESDLPPGGDSYGL
jgi:hypothetical protein